MAKIYQFPQGEERAKFRKEIARSVRNVLQ